MTQEQADRLAREKLDAWNRFIDRSLDGSGFVSPVERMRVLNEWAQAENKAGELRRNKPQGAEHATTSNHSR